METAQKMYCIGKVTGAVRARCFEEGAEVRMARTAVARDAS
jgi:hypothetical protein